MTLNEQVEEINSREDFIAFVYRLAQDLEENPSQWENPTLGHFLEAVGSWTEDMDGYFRNTGQPVPEKTSWKLFASILIAAKFYE